MILLRHSFGNLLFYDKDADKIAQGRGKMLEEKNVLLPKKVKKVIITYI